MDQPSWPFLDAEVFPIAPALCRFLADVDRPCLEALRTRTTALQMHTRQWIGTYSGKGNGDYRSELASALRAITTYLKLFALTPEVALVRLDGQYGDAVAMAQLMKTGVYFVTRARGYQILEHPQRKPRTGLLTDSECDQSEQR